VAVSHRREARFLHVAYYDVLTVGRPCVMQGSVPVGDAKDRGPPVPASILQAEFSSKIGGENVHMFYRSPTRKPKGLRIITRPEL
jgi:hypothetical protein